MLVPGIGVEPTSSGFSDQRSDRLSYPGILNYGVRDGARSRDLQGHNLTLLPTELLPPYKEVFFRL